ncbi:hypothetical protein GSI_07858 [Ganoderma sinense ZZ0214-1]|uniref:Uncharacterized protein n=1 Tax=Ganoderma sinense ZZ0214-1 TaxID=1077348 RepID=A0A2G8S887_9APHY|nr:hypothetical protein GSI_07858 [Ganoderma sinense ZZ0214-1]
MLAIHITFQLVLHICPQLDFLLPSGINLVQNLFSTRIDEQLRQPNADGLRLLHRSHLRFNRMLDVLVPTEARDTPRSHQTCIPLPFVRALRPQAFVDQAGVDPNRDAAPALEHAEQRALGQCVTLLQSSRAATSSDRISSASTPCETA